MNVLKVAHFGGCVNRGLVCVELVQLSATGFLRGINSRIGKVGDSGNRATVSGGLEGDRYRWGVYTAVSVIP